jgi:hypothetical protein
MKFKRFLMFPFLFLLIFATACVPSPADTLPTLAALSATPYASLTPNTPSPMPSSTSTPVPPTITNTATATATVTVKVGTYDMSIPYYKAVNETTFVMEQTKIEDLDPRISFLTNFAVETVYYTKDAVVHTIDDKKYIGVYRKSYMLSDNLNDDVNLGAIIYVEKRNIRPELEPAHPAEQYLRNRILQSSSSFSVTKMKSENDVYRVDLSYYIIRGLRRVDICKNGGEYGVVDILVYIPGKGLMKHGLAVVFFTEKGQNEGFENLYRYNSDIQDYGAEARIATTMFSFANHTDFTQSFNSTDWFNNVTAMNNFDSSWNHEEGQIAYRHASCFAKEYERFLESKGERYTIFLIPEQTSTSGFLNGTVQETEHFITEEEYEAIWDFIGRNPLIPLGEED